MSRYERLAPLSGFLVTALILAGFLLSGDTPGSDDSAAKIAQFYSDNDTKVLISSFLITVAGAALVWFAASLRSHIRVREVGPGRISSIVLAAAVIIAVGLTLFAGIEAAEADVVGDVPPAALQALNALDNNMFFTLALGNLLFFLAVTVAIFRFGILPRWLGWITALMALVAFTPAFFVTILLSGIFYPLVGYLLYTGQDAAGPAAPAVPPATA
jgi:hypothetical protein